MLSGFIVQDKTQSDTSGQPWNAHPEVGSLFAVPLHPPLPHFPCERMGEQKEESRLPNDSGRGGKKSPVPESRLSRGNCCLNFQRTSPPDAKISHITSRPCGADVGE